MPPRLLELEREADALMSQGLGILPRKSQKGYDPAVGQPVDPSGVKQEHFVGWLRWGHRRLCSVVHDKYVLKSRSDGGKSIDTLHMEALHIKRRAEDECKRAKVIVELVERAVGLAKLESDGASEGHSHLEDGVLRSALLELADEDHASRGFLYAFPQDLLPQLRVRRAELCHTYTAEADRAWVMALESAMAGHVRRHLAKANLYSPFYDELPRPPGFSDRPPRTPRPLRRDEVTITNPGKVHAHFKQPIAERLHYLVLEGGADPFNLPRRLVTQVADWHIAVHGEIISLALPDTAPSIDAKTVKRYYSSLVQSGLRTEISSWTKANP